MTETEEFRQEDVTKVYPPIIRALLTACGLICVGLAIAGAVLPVLPTTPFLLLASACFMRASPRFDRWLLSHRTFGPTLLAWRTHRAMPRRAKRVALPMIAITFTGSIIVVGPLWLKGLLICVGLGVFTYVYRIPVRG